ncbi:hypothetical protein V1280_002978 [Bradyrhizobium sp. AZCC 2230]
MRETGRNPQLLPVLGGKLDGNAPSEGGRPGADIDGHVKDGANRASDQLALGTGRVWKCSPRTPPLCVERT